MYKTSDESFRVHNKNFDELRCKLDSTENPRSFEKCPTLSLRLRWVGYFEWNPVYIVFHRNYVETKRLRCGWVFLERTRILSGIQFTTYFIEIFDVETKRFVGSFVNVILTRQTCGQRSSRAAESKRWALGNYFSERMSCKFLISKCRGDRDLGLSTSFLAFAGPQRDGKIRKKNVFWRRKNLPTSRSSPPHEQHFDILPAHHLHWKSSLYLPLGSVNLVLKVMGTPDEIWSPPGWNRVSPGCPRNFNTELTEPTRQIKTTFPMNLWAGSLHFPPRAGCFFHGRQVRPEKSEVTRPILWYQPRTGYAPLRSRCRVCELGGDTSLTSSALPRLAPFHKTGTDFWIEN